MKIHRGRTIEEQRAFNTEQAKHPEYAIKSQEYRLRTPEKRKAARLKFRLKKRCWTVQEHEKAVKNQNGVCAICLKQKDLVPDHNHLTKTSRALLCTNCNFGLGNFKDDPVILVNAIKYLKVWSTQMIKITCYDPPSGWRFGFPREYKPLPGESLADTLRRDGYPEKMDPDWAAGHTRFWETDLDKDRKS